MAAEATAADLVAGATHRYLGEEGERGSGDLGRGRGGTGGDGMSEEANVAEEREGGRDGWRRAAAAVAAAAVVALSLKGEGVYS